MKKTRVLVSALLSVVFVILASSCQSSNAVLSEGNILFDCGISSLDDIESYKVEFYDESSAEYEITKKRDLKFLNHYTYSQEYPKTELDKLLTYPGVPRIIIKSAGVSHILYVMEDESIIVKSNTQNMLKTYTATSSRHAIGRSELEKLSKKY